MGRSVRWTDGWSARPGRAESRDGLRKYVPSSRRVACDCLFRYAHARAFEPLPSRSSLVSRTCSGGVKACLVKTTRRHVLYRIVLYRIT